MAYRIGTAAAVNVAGFDYKCLGDLRRALVYTLVRYLSLARHSLVSETRTAME